MQYIDIQVQITNALNIMMTTNKHHIFNIGLKVTYIDRQCLTNCLYMALNGKIYF